MIPTIHFFTRCTRLQNLPEIERSIFSSSKKYINCKWHIFFDIDHFESIPVDILKRYEKHELHYTRNSGYGMTVFNDVLYYTPVDDWFYILDDDNVVHPDFYKTVISYLNKSKVKALLFNQYVGGKDFTGLEIREIDPNNVKVKKVDSAQLLMRVDLWDKSVGFGGGYFADGEFIESVYEKWSDNFQIIQKVLCYYNYLEDTENAQATSLINTLVISDDPDYGAFDYYEYVNVERASNDWFVNDYISKFKPDSIITLSKDWKDFKELASLSPEIRTKWVHLNEATFQRLEEVAFNAGMHHILDTGRDPLISVFTPVYNIKEGLERTYESLKSQSYINWEWVLVNDSTDGKRTQKIIDEIVANDSRVKSYRLTENSKGNIGFVKYLACCLTSGHLLVELDHDDILFPEALDTIQRASEEYPECGFFYSDCIELHVESGTSLQYPDGWAFGYGAYYDFNYNGYGYKVAKAANINPKTIRHIVSAPNHVRVWRRDAYFNVGGHNKRLKIIDDYELMVRSFLTTKMCRIASPLYIQTQHNNNTTDYRRADIQKKVAFASSFYNDKIAQRFRDLGVVDWAYDANKDNPLWVPSLFGEKENAVNETFEN